MRVQAHTSATARWEVEATKSIAHLDLGFLYHQWFDGVKQRLRHSTALASATALLFASISGTVHPPR